MTTEQRSFMPSKSLPTTLKTLPAHQRLRQLGKAVALLMELILCLWMTAGDYFVSI